MYVKVRVRAGAKKEEVREEKPGYFAVAVREKAERNLANRRVCELVALQYVVPVSKVRIVNGHQSPSKLLWVEGFE